MKRIFTGLFLLFSLVLFNHPFAQVDQLSIDLHLFNPNAQVFYVGDLGFTGFGSVPNIFTITLQNNGTQPVRVQIHFYMRLNQATIADAYSNEFMLPPGTFSFTSSELNTGSVNIGGTQVEVQNYNISFDQIENLENQILATGRLPAGQYEFFVELIPIDDSGSPLPPIPDPNNNDNIMTITNPTTLEPLYPGTRVTQNTLLEVPTPFPYFMWQSDAYLFNLFVFEKYPSDESVQDVLSHEPVLHIEGYPNQIYQYPTDPSPQEYFDNNGNRVGQSVVIRMLEPGKIYYWYVQAIIFTGSGQQTLDSDVYQFKVADTEQSSINSQMILNYLQQILGRRYEEVMQQLTNFSPTGNILLNGTPVEIDALMNLINKLNQNKATIENVFVE